MSSIVFLQWRPEMAAVWCAVIVRNISIHRAKLFTITRLSQLLSLSAVKDILPHRTIQPPTITTFINPDPNPTIVLTRSKCPTPDYRCDIRNGLINKIMIMSLEPNKVAT